MSCKDFKRAMELLPSCRYYVTDGGKSTEQIRRAEQILGISFSPQLREFYAKLGYLSFFDHEIYGIDPEDESGAPEGNSVACALKERSQCGLPEQWIPISNNEDGDLLFLDYGLLNEAKEPRVIMCSYDGKQYQLLETVAEDFGSLLLEVVEEALEN